MGTAARRVATAVAMVAAFVVACGVGDVGDTGAPFVEAGADAPPSADAPPPKDGASAVDTGTDAPTDAGVDAPTEAGDAEGGGPAPPNILVVIGDDMGLDASVCHTVGPDPGRAPRIAALCASGVVFDNAWAAPVCSPSRAAILTGRHGFRTTVGAVNQPLPLSERALPTALVDGRSAYKAGAFGKWHLSNASNGGANHPNTVGFSRYAGNLQAQVNSFFNWARTVDGVTANSTTYATTALVDDANAWLATVQGPWFAWLAFNAPHSPHHVPPAALHTYVGLTMPPPPNPIDHFHASLEAMDTELGRFLDGLAPAARANTWVIFVGDNGTSAEVAQPPIVGSKGSLYQGGVQVPLVIAGPGVVAGGRRVDAPVHVLDIFSTVLELAGADLTKALPPGTKTIDSVSLVPYLKSPNQAALRPWVMTEVFGGAPFNGGKLGKTIRDEKYKLIRFADGTVELYDLSTDPYEANDLVAAGPLDADADAHYASLGAALDALLASP